MFNSKSKFDANKCKVNLKMLINRFNLLTQKKVLAAPAAPAALASAPTLVLTVPDPSTAQANLNKQQKRQVALLLKDDKEANARILIEHIIREDYTLESYELLKQYTEMLLARLNVVIQESELKAEVAEAVCALLYAGWLMGNDVPELHTLYVLFTAKYSKPYSDEVVQNKEKYLSHRLLRMLTSTQVPDASVVELYLSEIAKAYNVEWAPKPLIGGTIPGPISSTIGIALPLPGMPVQQPGPYPEGGVPPAVVVHQLPSAPGAPAQFVPGPTPYPSGYPAQPVASFAESGMLDEGLGGAPVPFAVALVKTPLGFGMQLDGDNVIVSIKPDTQASRSGQLQPGDRVVALNNVAVSRDTPVKSVAIDLETGANAVFSIVRRGGAGAAGPSGGGGGAAPQRPPVATPQPEQTPVMLGGPMPAMPALPVEYAQPQPHLPYAAPQDPYGMPPANPVAPGAPHPAYVAPAAPVVVPPAQPAAPPAESEDEILARRLEMLKRG